MIEKKCSNCIYFVDGIGEQLCCKFKNSTISTPRVFIPKEELIRKSEREKIITDLENEIQNFNEVRDRNIIEFIHDFIKELKEK